jgi:hypothetical protein
MPDHVPRLTERNRCVERDVERIKARGAKHGLKSPIALDNDGSNRRARYNLHWPTVYVVDRRGIVRYGREGELIFRGEAGEGTFRKPVDATPLGRP